jgi:hypothetical protein
MDTAEKRRFFLMISAVEFHLTSSFGCSIVTRRLSRRRVAGDEDFHYVGAEPEA